eukprot:TRINITY_DN2120_c0_g1_i1.p1 TRINITY_DN2120_c0_g1~~TRINITY_DN2120_c0_g1_i1.p1  ORF type:complete len:213 (-),score=46.92 TRINITY_DN2120_c0_g1_i1:79-717(-)
MPRTITKSKLEEDGLIIVGPQTFNAHSGRIQGKYLTHDNGGRMFLVSISKTGEYMTDFMVTVGKRSESEQSNENYEEMEDRKIGWDVPVVEIPKAKRVLVGYDVNYPGFGDGNSVLIELEGNKYVYVGSVVYGFSLEDPVKTYFSPLGNSDVPYPYAITKGGKYLVMEDFTKDESHIVTYRAPAGFEEDPYWNDKLEKADEVKIDWIHDRLI